MQDFEKLGLFYLGRSYDVGTRKSGEDLVLYDSRDLVTHAVCVGMTGSGKTGLCLTILEEAAIDHVPAIAIDPKGDIANLLLTFPGLTADEFAPWVSDDEAKKAGLSHNEFAQKQADLWKNGLAEWGQDGARIQRLRESAEFRVYTPGSTAGIPVSILQSFSAPPQAILDDPELLGDRIATTVTSLLGLLGIDADPMQSREHILVSNILQNAWKQGKDLDITALIPQIQNPPFSRVGVIELESFFPAKDRFALALRLNNLLAAPGFDGWLKGEPLDVDALLHGPDGKPRISILSIAHLSDSERMFFVSLLLNQVLGWVRTQPGTTSLRALLYMDEIYGYFPPVATPPSKRPLMTLLKQARAFGLGIVLATQNPADLDYKGLANTGTWFLGRLQAERDKLRVLEGLETAAAAQSAGFDRAAMDKILSSLGKRVFLLNNVHEDHPQVFQVRWSLSYLRGPLTRQQIKTLMDPVRPPADAPASASRKSSAPRIQSPDDEAAELPPSDAEAAGSETPQTDQPPLLAPGITQYYLPLRSNNPGSSTLRYRPAVLGFGELYYNDTKSGVNQTQNVALLAHLSHEALAIEWSEADPIELEPGDLEKDPPAPGKFEALPAPASKVRSYSSWSKAFVDALYRGQTLSLLKSKAMGKFSNPGESERDFRIRLQQQAKEDRDARIEKLRQKYAPKLTTLEDKIRRAEATLERETAQARSSGFTSLVKLGTTILDAFVGRKKISTTTISKASTTLRNVNQTMKESSDVARAQESLTALQQQYTTLESDFEKEVNDLERQFDPLTETFDTLELKPRKTNITARLVTLVWAPYWSGDGGEKAAWE